MQKRYLQILFIAIFCAISACQAHRESYLLSNFENIRVFEKQDHDFCVSLNLDSGADKVKSALYWRCRLSLAKHKIRLSSNAPEIAKYNFQISDLVTKISLTLAESKETAIAKENSKMDNRHHQECLNMGYNSNSRDQTQIDDYFICRKMLIDDQQLVPPFGNMEYAKYPNRSYSLSYTVNKRMEKEIKKYNDAKEKYPTCVKFNLKTENFARCTKAQDQSRQCFLEIDKKKFKKEAAEKIICQRKAYVNFPNSLLKDEDKFKNEIEEDMAKADTYGKNNFLALGLTAEKLEKFEAAKKDTKSKKAKQEELEKSINSKDKIYTRFELTRLRQQYIFLCQKEADGTITEYVEALKKSCEGMQYFDVVEDD